MEQLKLYLDPVVFGILGLMSVILLTLVVERYLFYSRVSLQKYAKKELLEVDLTRNLTPISSIGANAPYVGLLGTVLGILVTFYDMGKADTIDTSQIMVGLAMALKATAGGLVVAIPAMLFYNAMLRLVDVRLAQWTANHAPSIDQR